MVVLRTPFLSRKVGNCSSLRESSQRLLRNHLPSAVMPSSSSAALALRVLNIQILDAQGVVHDEVAARFDEIAHQVREREICKHQVIE